MLAVNDTSKQASLIREMLRHFKDNRLSAGQQLPTEAEWAERYLVSRVTVRAALRRLCEEGWVVREQGRGTFLARSPLDESAAAATLPAATDEAGEVPASFTHGPREVGLLLRWAYPTGQPDLYHEEIIAGVKDATDALGAKLSTWFVEAGETPVETAARVLADRKGVSPPAFVLSAVSSDEPLDDWPAEASLCCIGPPLGNRPLSYVDIDSDYGAWLATSHLLSLGRRRIALFGNFVQRYMQSRIRGYARALQEAGVPFDPALVVDGVHAGGEHSVGAEALRGLWERGIRPDGIFADSSAVAGVWRASREAGLRVPENLSLVGMDDFSWIMARIPMALTAVVQPFRAAAAAAARMALSAKGTATPGRMKLFRPQLLVRESCGASRLASLVPAGGEKAAQAF